ncbi:N-acetylmuramoyl-L-alanine amidase [Balneolales bacterium ANBcel1]|nr:N-acetylmuramoyl-L-alanine amidase [Balneolales bacterium ANBcel1]
MRLFSGKPVSGVKARSPGRINSSPLLLPALLVLTALLSAPSPGLAAPPLEKVSTVERSDGLGYVVRFHLSSRPDSFHIWQPNPKLIQLALYKDGISSEHIITENNNGGTFDSFFFQDIQGGIGADIYLYEGIYMIADAYLDANRQDLLVGLTEASPYDLEVLTDGLYPIFWDDLLDDVDTTPDLALNTWSEPDAGSSPADPMGDITFTPEMAGPFLQLNRIVIDPGHGGRDPGAIGHRGTYEKDVALAVALKLGEYIEQYLPEIEVVYTRKDDRFIPLQERGQIANRAEADLFVSIHANGNQNRHAHGTEIYFLGMHRSQAAFEVMKKENSAIRFEQEEERSEELTPEQLAVYELSNIGFMASSEMLAGKMDRQFSERAMRRSRGVRQAGFIVLYHASMPAVLVELGYITNPQEEQFLVSDYGQSIMASAIFRSIRDYKERLERSRNRESR